MTSIKNQIRAEIERLKNQLIRGACAAQIEMETNCKDEAYNEVLAFLDTLPEQPAEKQEQPKLTRVPRIEQETQKKGWMDYDLLIGEIGLHRSNAIDRIKETKERAAEIKRNIAPRDLAILSEYLESAGAEIVLCCLQQYCMDFMFTQDEVKEILQQEQPVEGLLEEVDRFWANEFKYHVNSLPTISVVQRIARHFAEWQKKQDQKTIELAEDHAMLAGMNKMEQQMMEKGYEAFISAHNTIPVLPMKDVSDLGLDYGDKVRVIVIKEDEK